MKSISAILLGAGESKRMGENKLLLPWGKKTILHQSLKTLLNSRVKEVILVVNDHIDPLIRTIHHRRVKVVLNPDYRQGMSRSIQKGVEATDPDSHGILIALADQPFIRSRTIDVLIDAFHERKGRIIVPSFRGKRGHPVIFPQKFREELLRLVGDEGGKTILGRHPEEVYVVPVKASGVVRDIDTPTDYRKALRTRKKPISGNQTDRSLR